METFRKLKVRKIWTTNHLVPDHGKPCYSRITRTFDSLISLTGPETSQHLGLASCSWKLRAAAKWNHWVQDFDGLKKQLWG